MSDDYIQPGCEVSKREYEAFKQFVQDQHGKVRGNLGRELANAMAYYRKRERGDDRLQRIEDDVAQVKALLADAEADGGSVAAPPTDLSDADPHTRADQDDDADDDQMEKPHANQPRDAKVDWLVQETRDSYNGTVAVADLRDDIQDAYGFREDTLSDHVDLVLERLGAEVDPRNPDVLRSWGEALEDAREDAQAQQEEDAASEFDRLDDAEVER